MGTMAPRRLMTPALWADCGNRQEALDLLVPIHGWFTDGHTVRDLIEAKQLLDALV